MTGSYILVKFETDGSQTYTGFNLNYSIVPNCTPPATPSITITGSTLLCQTGGSVTLTGPAGFRYIWSNGDTTRNLVVTRAGSYSLSTVSNGCTSATSSPVVVTVANGIPTPFVSALGSTSICNGDSTRLAIDNTAEGYLWSNGATTQTITVRQAGSYTARLIVGACTSAQSSSTLISVVQPPSQPVIVQLSADSLDAGVAASSYIWKLDAATLGSSARKIKVTSNGSYTVTALGSSDCRSVVSAPFVVTNTKGLIGYNIQVYPNPTSKILNINSASEQLKQVSFYGVDGKLVFRQALTGSLNQITVPKTAGIYSLAIETSQGIYYQKLVVE